jgi:integrase
MSRIDAVIGFATAHGYREGDSPAKWKNGLDAVFTADRERTHFRAMAYSDLPGFLTDLRKKEGVGAAALEFLVLTASRLTEARGAAWGEINLETKTWTIPAARMKAGQEHKVPLSSRAVEILTSQKRQNGFVFAGYRIGKPIGPEALRDLVPDGATIHGMRSSFADWAAEQTRFSHEDIEVCLAHTIGNATSRAYRRTDLLERRRDIMESWSNYVTGATSAKVIAIGGKAAKHP